MIRPFKALIQKLQLKTTQLVQASQKSRPTKEITPRESNKDFAACRLLDIDGTSYELRGDSYLANMPHDYEPALCKLLKIASSIAGEGAAMDVGANIGATAILLSKHWPEVLAFEASPRTCKILKENIASNHINNVHIFGCGLGARDEELPITAAQNNASGGFLSQAIQHLEGHITEIASIRNGDTFLNEQQINQRIALIKIDVEGHELEALSGLSHRLEQDKPIIILEMNHWCLNAFKRCSIPDFLDQLQAITPHILAFDDGSESAIVIGRENQSATYHVMHEHIVNNKYPTLLLAPNPVVLKTMVQALAKH